MPRPRSSVVSVVSRSAIVAAACACALVAFVVAGCGTGSSGQQTPKRTSATPHAAVVAANGLAVDLLQRLGKPDENTVFSPYSVQAALAMVDAGAAGETASQMNKVLRASSAAALDASNATLANDLQGATHASGGADAKHGVNLSIANSLWLQTGFTPKHTFTDALTRYFAASAQQLDFAKDSEGARGTINKWVADRTAGHIQGLMPPGSITGDTKLVLANAVYLKSHWEYPFDRNATSPGPFFTATGARKSAEIMGLPTTTLSFTKTKAYDAIELPYEHSTLSMVIVMPPRGALPAFQRGLTPASLDTVLASVHTGRVKLLLPRFHVTIHTRSRPDAVGARDADRVLRGGELHRDHDLRAPRDRNRPARRRPQGRRDGDDRGRRHRRVDGRHGGRTGPGPDGQRQPPIPPVPAGRRDRRGAVRGAGQRPDRRLSRGRLRSAAARRCRTAQASASSAALTRASACAFWARGTERIRQRSNPRSAEIACS